jgi:glycosyltransferase involved in cell wall biosynthesis
MGLRLGIFGTFYPVFNLGNSTTPLALGLSRLKRIERVTVFCQFGGRLPPGAPSDKLEVIPCWRHEDPLSLLRALCVIQTRRELLDCILVNTFVTAFGRSRLANVVGLALPSAIGRLTSRPTITYMHNFMETQDVENLGYSPGRVTSFGVALLERMMLYSTSVVVPLRDQAETVRASFGVRPESFYFPYLESWLVAEHLQQGDYEEAGRGPRSFRILLPGSWGPQKDLRGSLRALALLQKEGIDFQIVITGDPNPHFPEYRISTTLDEFPSLRQKVQILGKLKVSDFFKVIMQSDLLLLPYNATGGYSGTMNFAALVGVPMVAYDNAQLREQSAFLGADVTFVSRTELAEAIRQAMTTRSAGHNIQRGDIRMKLEVLQTQFQRFGDYIGSVADFPQRDPARVH